MFMSIDDSGAYATSIISPEGTFRVDRAPIGQCAVTIDNIDLRANAPGSYVELPAKYRIHTATDLFVELKPGMNRGLTIDLKSQ